MVVVAVVDVCFFHGYGCVRATSTPSLKYWCGKCRTNSRCHWYPCAFWYCVHLVLVLVLVVLVLVLQEYDILPVTLDYSGEWFNEGQAFTIAGWGAVNANTDAKNLVYSKQLHVRPVYLLLTSTVF